MPVAALVAIGFAAGCALAPSLGLPIAIAAAGALLFTIALTVLILRQRGPRLTLLLLAALCAGLAARAAQRSEQLALVHALESDLVEHLYLGEVQADTGAPLDNRELLVATTIEVAGSAQPAQVLLRLHGLPAAWPRLQPGVRVQFRTRLVPPAPAWQPGQFDFRSLWLARGVIARGTIGRPGALVVLATQVPMWAIGSQLARLRQALNAQVDRALPEDAAALTRAMVLGDQTDVSRELRAPFDGAGTGHLLSVSGLHVGAFAALLFALCNVLSRRSEWLSRRIAPRRLAALCAAPSGVLFALVAGGSPPALRAGIMSLAICIGIALWRERATSSALGLAALLLLGLSPAAVDDVSFVLSFGAAAAMIYGAPRLLELAVGQTVRDPDDPRVQLAAALSATLAAGLISMPLGALYFGRLAPYSVLANLVVVPASAFGLPVAISSVLAGCTLAPIGGALGWLGGQLIGVGAAIVLALRDLSGFFSAWPGALIDVRPPSVLAVGLLLVGGALLIARRRGWRWRGTGLVALLAGAALALAPGWHSGHRLRLYFLPVGQGDATLVVTPAGRAVLVDAAGTARSERDPGLEVVLPALHELGIDRLAAVVISHPDFDHYGGLRSVVAAGCPAEVWATDLVDADPAWSELQTAFDRCGSVRRRFDRDRRSVELDGVVFEVLHPLVEASSAAAHWPEFNKNDNSLVLRIRHGERSFMLPGDLSELGEASLLDAGALSPVDVLKCGHHGSARSSSAAWLQALRPRHAVVAAGYANRFGHPALAVLERLAAVDARVWRTDRHGRIEVSSDGVDLVVTPFRVEEVPDDESRCAPDGGMDHGQ